MSTDIKIKKGLDIKLKGEAKKELSIAPHSKIFTVYPEDFHSIIPKLSIKVGEKVKVGDAIFYNKTNEAMKFTSPVSGEIAEVIRGEKRKILAITIQADSVSVETHKDFGIKVPSNLAEPQIKQQLLESGCWTFIKQRPYDVIANPANAPKAIFISGFNSAPLSADVVFTLQGKEEAFQTGIDALTKLTTGKVHLSVNEKDSFLNHIKGVSLHTISGPHPAGNVGTQINKIDPVNKGEVVWTVNVQDVAIIGTLFLTGKYNAERIVALAGSSVENPKYYTTKIGATIISILNDAKIAENSRIISGNVLTGKNVGLKGSLRHYNSTITAIPEGDDYEFLGWTKPVFNKISITRAMTFSWLTPNKKFDLNTNTNGEHRGFVLTGTYEKVFPLDIYPMQILKSCMYQDLDEMEALGMYEVAPEDFALTEFICVSKQAHQEIIRKGLDLMLKEIG
ncbi:MAG: Na(+)-translocating NADH-quinone reductase subunit A [Flavobacteriaceae bacterium]|nr:Na(+)-translocating NADH-quinone reductase subunit A [Flavobacteriaceae bacterium]